MSTSCSLCVASTAVMRRWKKVRRLLYSTRMAGHMRDTTNRASRRLTCFVVVVCGLGLSSSLLELCESSSTAASSILRLRAQLRTMKSSDRAVLTRMVPCVTLPHHPGTPSEALDALRVRRPRSRLKMKWFGQDSSGS